MDEESERTDEELDPLEDEVGGEPTSKPTKEEEEEEKPEDDPDEKRVSTFKLTLVVEGPYEEELERAEAAAAEESKRKRREAAEAKTAQREKPAKSRASSKQSRANRNHQRPDTIENEQKALIMRFWSVLVRRDLPRHTRAFQSFHKKRVSDSRKLAEQCQREFRTRVARTERAIRNSQTRMKRLVREMNIFQKKVDKLEAEKRRIAKAEQARIERAKLIKVKAEKKVNEQAEARRRALEERRRAEEEKKRAEIERKRAEELREAKRQQQRLNFLLTQTELYSHFMANKMNGTDPAAAGAGGNGGPSVRSITGADIDAEDPEELALAEQANIKARSAVAKTAAQAEAFDLELAHSRGQVGGGGEPASTTNGSVAMSTVQQPRNFAGDLKKYQLKGLQWLVSLYEQGINGILADEMGLGKTIQAIAFLSHLAEEKDIWGPFLIVAPSSTLHNWASEVQRFCPSLRVLPYWGQQKDRQIFRKSFSTSKLHTKDAAFHVLITSYQLVVTDEKHFKRVKWQNMVLDEAQNIKSSQSQRWKSLLAFSCRNRLLLTGTPVQNSMAELWALLHFIMPTLFDNHQQFNDWFSKGIEAHASEGGGLDEHQLKRLHAILQPFMLRRVKADVEEEMAKKTEITMLCSLSSRQRSLYQVLRKKISVTDFLRNADMSEQSVQNLMNILAQLRKVCNHPELFEHQEARSPFHFSEHSLSGPSEDLEGAAAAAARSKPEFVSNWGNKSPVSMHIPKLVFRDGMIALPVCEAGSAQGFRQQWISSMLSIYKADNVYYSSYPHCEPGAPANVKCARHALAGCMGFASLIGLCVGDVESIAMGNELIRWSHDRLRRRKLQSQREHYSLNKDEEKEGDDGDVPASTSSSTSWLPSMLIVQTPTQSRSFRRECMGSSEALPPLVVGTFIRLLRMGSLLKISRTYIPKARAPSVQLKCSDRSMTVQSAVNADGGWQRWLATGRWPRADLADVAPPVVKEMARRYLPPRPLLDRTFRYFGGDPDVPRSMYSLAKALTDSGKLLTLDKLLTRLKTEGHRVLIFCQMTKMMNLLEEYMQFKHFRYFRLDGSTGVSERRDLVNEFQENDDIFIFLLSTRAGGLGINLTAADTVIFYESDWNPTMDLQAMDRAHRLGQKKDVTVYRIICRGTIEEKIVKRAQQKNTVQQLVMTGGDAKADVFEPEEALSLLIDDAEMEQQLRDATLQRKQKKKTKLKGMFVGGGGGGGGGVGGKRKSQSAKKPADANGNGVTPVNATNGSDAYAMTPTGSLSAKLVQSVGDKRRARDGDAAVIAEESPPVKTPNSRGSGLKVKIKKLTLKKREDAIQSTPAEA